MGENLELTKEQELGRNASLIERRAMLLDVSTDLGYVAAGELLKEVKGLGKATKAYWDPVRASAKTAYDAVVEKRGQMLGPVENAEALLKGKMSRFVLARRAKASAQLAQSRKVAQDAIDAKLEEASARESAGDLEGAYMALADAEVYDMYSGSAQATVTVPKVEGVSTSRTWKITVEDSDAVPVSVNGKELRPVDTAAILRLVKEAKGDITIPGVKIAEDVTISVRV